MGDGAQPVPGCGGEVLVARRGGQGQRMLVMPGRRLKFKSPIGCQSHLQKRVSFGIPEAVMAGELGQLACRAHGLRRFFARQPQAAQGLQPMLYRCIRAARQCLLDLGLQRIQVQ